MLRVSRIFMVGFFCFGLFLFGCAQEPESQQVQKSETMDQVLDEAVETAQDVVSTMTVAGGDEESKEAMEKAMAAEMITTSEPKYVYMDKGRPENSFIPSGWMGDVQDLRMNDGVYENPKSGPSCIKVTYTPSGTNLWAGIYWQSAENNWGRRKTGYNLKGLNKLSFWAKGEEGGEVIAKFKIGGIGGEYADTASDEIGPVELTTEWQEYTINLLGDDLSYINGGFCLTISADQNPGGAVFYLDDIKFSKDTELKEESNVQELPFYVYKDKADVENHGIPSGFMGDTRDVKIEQGYEDNVYADNTCIRVSYSNAATEGARWAGVYWQNPANNWGTVDGGFDLSQATQISFWARGDKGGEVIDQFKVGGISGEYADSDVVEIGPVKLEQEWKQYSIDLTDRDLSYISGIFCWAANLDNNPEGAVFYLDEIRFE